MNTSNIKTYAPKARNEFMHAVAKRLNTFGISANKKGSLQITEARSEGSVLQIGNYTFDVKLQSSRNRLVQRAEHLGFAQLVEHVAYTWFNRLCAIRYMEIHDYLNHGFRVLSHPDSSQGAGATNKGRFEILDHAQDAAEELGLDRNLVIDLKLAGDKDEELYRELLLGQCHKLHEAMPFLFDALDDETELLLPDNLTRTDSILRGLVDCIPEEDWQQVEVIGWLYQFYISEKKDQVIGKVVKSEDIPAATQLFTPNWIVKYLVQNSVGRQWLQTYPESAIKTQMEYYISTDDQPESVLKELKKNTPESLEPEQIKVLDPACGSGHILIEAYNVLKAIYEERGFRSRDIPKMILENNLYGLDIDDRAAQLAGFALMMMAREDDRRIFTRDIQLNILALQESQHLELGSLWQSLNLSDDWKEGHSQGLFDQLDAQADFSSANADDRYQLLYRILSRFTQAKTFGSLIDIPAEDKGALQALYVTIKALADNGDIMQSPAAKTLLPYLHQALILATRFDAVIANPPYMGSKGMNSTLKEWAKKAYPDSKSDLFAIFMEHAFSLLKSNGFNAQINMQSWMFLSRYELLRSKILEDHTFVTMAHLGARAFSQISGEVVQTTAWVVKKNYVSNYFPRFYCLTDGNEDLKKESLFKRQYEFSNMSQDYFKKIPSSPIAYWVDDKALKAYGHELLSEHLISDGAVKTGDNETYIRFQWEIRSDQIGISSKWRPHPKGGEYRKWYGNTENVVLWTDTARSHYRADHIARILDEKYWDLRGISWSAVCGGKPSFRLLEEEGVANNAALCVFPKIHSAEVYLSYLNSSVFEYFLKINTQTVNYLVGDVQRVPFAIGDVEPLEALCKEAIEIAKQDWRSQEISNDFIIDNIVRNSHVPTIEESLALERYENEALSERLREIEQYNNEIFSDYFELGGVVETEVKIENISLVNNMKFRYPGENYQALFKCEKIVNLISFIIGCVMGRFSLDRKGLVYAKSLNEGFSKLVSEGAYNTFNADDDGIIPLTDQEWFKDDATNRCREFVQVVWGEEHLQENLDFVAESLCLNAIKPKKSELALETIRRYLSTQFYKDHLKTYKKRPIYWLFSSGKQKTFECLVYLHRYNEGTLSRMRTEYVTPLLGKYDAYAEQLEKQIETADSTSEANRLKKELTALTKKQVELREFDDKLKHYADMRISLDLDDGVKVNYGKFGDLLADVKGVTGVAPEVK